jgi:cysteine desulfurase
LNALGLWGFDEALKDWAQNGDTYRARWLEHKKFLLGELSQIEGLVIHGGQRDVDLPNTINFHVEGCLEESLLLSLDLSGYSMSSGSACNSGSMRPSHVIKALGYAEPVAFSSLRLSMGVETTRAELEQFVQDLKIKATHIRSSRAQMARDLPQIKA